MATRFYTSDNGSTKLVKENDTMMQACTALAVVVILLVVLYFLGMWDPMKSRFTPEQSMSASQLYQWTNLGMAMNPNNPADSFELWRHSVVPISQNNYQLRSMDGKRYATVYSTGVLKDGDQIQGWEYWPSPATVPHTLVVQLKQKEGLGPGKFNMHASMVPLTVGNEVPVPRRYQGGPQIRGYADMMPYAMVREGLKHDQKSTPVF
jgi:hypothetical protein